MSGAALSTRLVGALAYVSGDPVDDLASAMGHEWLATCVPVQDVLSQGILRSSTTCGISGCSEGRPACYRQLVVIFDPALIKQASKHLYLPDQ